VSNVFIGNPKVLNADSLIRFTKRARNDTLWTSARKLMIYKEDGLPSSRTCGNKRFCDLFYILKNYTYTMKEKTGRQNMIQGLLVDVIRKHS
jgi:hypothetical protein